MAKMKIALCYVKDSDFEFQNIYTSRYKKEIPISTSGFDTVEYSASKSKDGGL